MQPESERPARKRKPISERLQSLAEKRAEDEYQALLRVAAVQDVAARARELADSPSLDVPLSHSLVTEEPGGAPGDVSNATDLPVHAGEKECPRCAEWIKAKAKACRFCQHELTPSSPAITLPVARRHFSSGKFRSAGPREETAPLSPNGSQMNKCGACGHTWYPRGHARSSRCPDCKAAEVILLAPMQHEPLRMSGLAIAIAVLTLLLGLVAILMDSGHPHHR